MFEMAMSHRDNAPAISDLYVEDSKGLSRLGSEYVLKG